MASKSFRYFLKGIELRGEAADPSDNLEGSIWSNSTSNRFKGYIQAAIREFVTTDQTQTLTNKTIVVTNNTITTAPNGNLTSTELNNALAELQTDIDTRATQSSLNSHTGASAAVHGVTGSVVGTSDTQTLTNKTLVDNSTVVVGSADATKKINFENNPATTGTTLTLQATQTVNRVIAFPDASDTLVGVGATQTLTNKTLTSPVINTPTGITKSDVGLNNVDNTSDATKNAAVATLTNKTIIGADIQTPVRSDVKQGTKSALNTYASTASNGQLVFATDTKEYLAVKDGVLVDIGGSGGVGSVDTLMSQTFDKAALTDFTQTGMELVASPFIQGAFTARLIHQAASTYSFKQIVAANPKFRGQLNTLAFSARSTAASANVTVTITDETNSAVLLSSTFTTGQITSNVFNTASSTTVTVTSNTILNQIKVGASISGSGIPTGTTVTAVNSTAGTITISQAATATATGVSLKVSVLPKTQKYTFAMPANCASVSYTISALAESGLPETYVDDVQIYLTQNPQTSYSITQTTFNATDWTPYTPTFTGFGTPSAVEFEYRQVGGNYEIRGKFTSGTTTATEARISLPAGATSAGTSIIPSLQQIGVMSKSVLTATYFTVLIEPSVTYITLGAQNASLAGLTKQTGSNLSTSGESFSLTASIPIAGLTANTTTTSTIPLTSSVLVTQPDSQMTWQGYAGLGSTRTKIPYFTNARTMTGSAISYTSSTTNGLEVTVLEDGYYNIQMNATDDTSGTTVVAIGCDLTDFTTGPAARYTDTTVLKIATGSNGSTNRDSASVQWSGPLRAGQKIYPILDTSITEIPATLYFSVSKVGSTKIINPSSDQKIEIPTHELRFEGASARGSTDTAIVKFDTQAKIKGDGFTVVNTAANGTVITVRKAGILSVSSTVRTNASALHISKNQQTLTTAPSASERLASSLNSGSTTTGLQFVSYSGVVAVGDIIRISAEAVPTSDVGNNLSLSLQETSVAVALQNVTPTYDNSDSSVRVGTGNGFGSTNTSVRRFSNTYDNFGTDITYTDSATLGGYFTINKDGIYEISYTEAWSGTTDADIVIAKNTTTFTQGDSNNLVQTRLESGGDFETVAVSAYLVKGDVVRALTGTPAGVGSTAGQTRFTISRVGKTSGTVDVTPFVNIPTQDTDFIRVKGTAVSTVNGTIQISTVTDQYTKNNGIIQLINDSTNGMKIRVLKDCTINIASNFNTINTANIKYLYKNGNIYTNLFYANLTNTASHSGFTDSAVAGDIYYYGPDVTNIGSAASLYTITAHATAINNSVTTSTQQVSSDTLSFVFKSTAIDGSVDPIGTFNTYTYAANTNTATIAGTAPTQTTSDMNVNGVRVFARAYNAASTAASPARVDIFIGKGLKSRQIDAYFNTGKTAQLVTDFSVNSSTEETGTTITYNETTGILSVDVGLARLSANTSRYILDAGNNLARASGYFVFNASKSPSLVSIPNLAPRVAYISEQQASGSAGGSTVANTWTTRTLNTLVDNTGIVTSLSANTITLPAGTYRVSASAPFFNCAATTLRLRNTTDNTTAVIGQRCYSASGVTSGSSALLEGEFTITSAKGMQIQYYAETATATNGLGTAHSTGEVAIFSQVAITKIK